MRLVHRNLTSQTIVVLILAAIVSIFTSVTSSGGIGNKGDKEQEQDQDKDKEEDGGTGT